MIRSGRTHAVQKSDRHKPPPSPFPNVFNQQLHSPTDVALVLPHAEVPLHVVPGISQLGGGEVADLTHEGLGACRAKCTESSSTRLCVCGEIEAGTTDQDLPETRKPSFLHDRPQKNASGPLKNIQWPLILTYSSVAASLATLRLLESVA